MTTAITTFELKQLYETDFNRWLMITAMLLKQRELESFQKKSQS